MHLFLYLNENHEKHKDELLFLNNDIYQRKDSKLCLHCLNMTLFLLFIKKIMYCCWQSVIINIRYSLFSLFSSLKLADFFI